MRAQLGQATSKLHSRKGRWSETNSIRRTKHSLAVSSSAAASRERVQALSKFGACLDTVENVVCIALTALGVFDLFSSGS